MPRPRRARRAPARAPARTVESDISDHDDLDAPRTAEPARGRGRTARSKDARVSVADQEAILIATQSRDAALDRLAAEDPTTTSGNAVEDSESGGSVELGRRGLSTPQHRRDTTGLDLADDDVFGDLDDSFEDGDVPRGRQSTDTSSLNLSNFRRRPRQSSIIGRNDPPIRPSSRGGNTPSISSTLNLGVFRRRAREPSILGTARKPRPDETITVPDSESESEEDFEPEAESTPLNRRRTRLVSESERDSSPEILSNLKSRKRKSEEALPSSDRPEKMSRLDLEDEEEEEEEAEAQPRENAHPVGEVLDSDTDSSLSSISSPSGPRSVLPERPSTPINSDEIIAPPASSGSEDAGDVWPDIRTLAKRRRRPSVTTPIRVDDMSDISSPPSLTHSPNFEIKAPRTRGRQQTRRHSSPKMTTADLTSMLPKRRYMKTRDPFDLDSEDEIDNSGLGRDEDELSYLDTGARRRRGGSRSASRPTSRGGRAAPAALKARQTAASARQSKQNAKTYSRRSSDKENEGEGHEDDDEEEEEEQSRFIPLPDDTFDNGEGESTSTPSADELKRASRKFKEVDRWELEFEEVTRSSSPSNAR